MENTTWSGFHEPTTTLTAKTLIATMRRCMRTFEFQPPLKRGEIMSSPKANELKSQLPGLGQHDNTFWEQLAYQVNNLTAKERARRNIHQREGALRVEQGMKDAILALDKLNIMSPPRDPEAREALSRAYHTGVSMMRNLSWILVVAPAKKRSDNDAEL